MPEIIEIEMYRQGALPVIGRTIASVDAPDDWYLKGVDAATITGLLVGSRVIGLDRVGKLMIVETNRAEVGLRFGMTGRLVADGTPVIEQLEYSSKRLDPAWNRFGLGFDDGTDLIINDPRRLGGVTIDPDRDTLGPDAWSLTSEQLAQALARSRSALKARLLDQSRIAGLGNLLVDEILWASGFSPKRPARSLSAVDVDLLRSWIEATLDELAARGGSNTGPLFPHRDGGLCPRCASPLGHDTVGGRSTWWCSQHQL